MIKIIIYIGKAAMYLPFVYLIAEVEALPSTTVSAERWAAFFLWVLLMISIGVAAKKAFESVWLKKGFEGVEWDMSYYDKDRNMYWASRFFDNEIDARKSCG